MPVVNVWLNFSSDFRIKKLLEIDSKILLGNLGDNGNNVIVYNPYYNAISKNAP